LVEDRLVEVQMVVDLKEVDLTAVARWEAVH